MLRPTPLGVLRSRMLVQADWKGSKITGLLLDARDVRHFLPEQASAFELRAFSLEPFPKTIASKVASPQTPGSRPAERASSGREQADSSPEEFRARTESLGGDRWTEGQR
jgi:hypothetical protein